MAPDYLGPSVCTVTGGNGGLAYQAADTHSVRGTRILPNDLVPEGSLRRTRNSSGLLLQEAACTMGPDVRSLHPGQRGARPSKQHAAH